MQIDHDSAMAIEEAVWLVNSDDPRTGIDHLDTPDALESWVVERGISGTRAGTDSELRAVHRLRRRLRRIFDLAVDHARDARAARPQGSWSEPRSTAAWCWRPRLPAARRSPTRSSARRSFAR